jgi:copper chaperone CopZ
MRIEAVVGGREEVEKVDVDLESKKVEVHSSLDPAELIDLFDQAGYDAELLQDN